MNTLGHPAEPRTLLGILMLGDEPFQDLVEARQGDVTTRYALCRRIGAGIRGARLRAGLSLDELAAAAATSPRLLRLIEGGALDEPLLPDETVEGLCEALALEPADIYTMTGAGTRSLSWPQWDALVERFQGWMSGLVLPQVALPLPVRALGHGQYPVRTFGRGITLSPIPGRADAMILRISDGASGIPPGRALLAVVQDESGEILADHVFSTVAGDLVAELPVDPAVVTESSVALTLAAAPLDR